MFRFFMGIALVASVSQFAYGIEGSACSNIKWDSNKVYTLKAKKNNAVHIILPEKLLTSPIVGNSDLWIVEGAGNHIFVKPSSELRDGSTTTLSAITKTNKSYDFRLVRSNSSVNQCVRIQDGIVFAGDQKAALENYEHPDITHFKRESNTLRAQIASIQQAATEEKKSAVREALRAYRSHIYTRYEWSKGSGFIGKNLISDIYDDGRFTFIRLNNDNKGLLTVESRLSKKKEIVEVKYDTVAKVYQLVGIFPEFSLIYDKTKVKVRRGDNETKGDY